MCDDHFRQMDWLSALFLLKESLLTEGSRSESVYDLDKHRREICFWLLNRPTLFDCDVLVFVREKEEIRAHKDRLVTIISFTENKQTRVSHKLIDTIISSKQHSCLFHFTLLGKFSDTCYHSGFNSHIQSSQNLNTTLCFKLLTFFYVKNNVLDV